MVDIAFVPPNGARPDYHSLWGTDDLDFLSRCDGLLLFRLNPLGAYCQGTAETYTPPPQEERLLLEVRPNREIVLLHPPLPPADMLTLEAFTEPSDEAFWQLDPAKILAAAEAGRPVSDLEVFLQARSNPLPRACKHSWPTWQLAPDSFPTGGAPASLNVPTPPLPPYSPGTSGWGNSANEQATATSSSPPPPKPLSARRSVNSAISSRRPV